MAWTVVTHVCSHWRRVAEQYPKLWEYIPLLNHNWTQRALLLSHPRSIIVQTVSGRSPFAESLHLALRELPRIRVLWLSDQFLDSGAAEPELTSVMQIFSSSAGSRLADAAALEELHLVGSAFIPLPVRAPDPAPLPCLHSLFVVGMPLPALGCFQQCLTHLKLADCKPWASTAHVLDTLAILPSLESLSIDEGVLPTPIIDARETPRVVSLRCLQYLDVIGDSRELVELLDALRFPEEGELHLRLTGIGHARDEAITALAGAVTHHYSSPVRFQRLAITHHAERGNYWTLREGVVAGRAVPGLLNFVADADGGPRTVVSYVSRLLALLPVADSLRHLDIAIGAEGPIAGSIWTRVARRARDEGHATAGNIWTRVALLARGVEHVSAIGVAAGELIHALRGVGNNPRGSPLPSMSTLCITTTVFPETQGPHTPDMRDVEPLLDAARGWHAAGMPLQITFKKCQVSAELVDLLKKELGQEAVTWDGILAIPELDYKRRMYWTTFE
ncbi:hypothetical protein BC834DRAFT_852380 [Gloeopeniophorella convolvens]|nr:hypothetical protein BC834DRAFT_852380 [Gloeopeniophorella convolvens]